MTQGELFDNSKEPGGQTGKILRYLQDGNSLTPIEALNLFGCFRLGARIWDLRQRHYDIESNLIEVSSGKHVAEYRLKEACICNG